MTGTSIPRQGAIAPDVRTKLIKDPKIILDDIDLMRALIGANDQTRGENVVDLRGIAMDRMQDKLGQLENTHKSVVAAAYDNLNGTNQVHRAVLQMLDPVDFETFMANLDEQVAEVLRVDHIRLVLETDCSADDPAVKRLSDVLSVAAPGFVDDYIGETRRKSQRVVTLRYARQADVPFYGHVASKIRSEALLRINLGKDRHAAMLVMGSENADHFRPGQATDFLAFFAGVCERAMRRWLT